MPRTAMLGPPTPTPGHHLGLSPGGAGRVSVCLSDCGDLWSPSTLSDVGLGWAAPRLGCRLSRSHPAVAHGDRLEGTFPGGPESHPPG